jgi:hypothetical protein
VAPFKSVSVFGPLETSIIKWVPAILFSFGMDALVTGMIAGRLIYHHRLQRKVLGNHPTSYIPVIVIFIESAALSTASKLLQLFIALYAGGVAYNPIVVPLSVSWNNQVGS